MPSAAAETDPLAHRPPLRRPRFYGWVMLPVATTAMIATSPGQTFGISMFNPSLRDTLGLTDTQLTGAYMAGTFLASLALPWVGAAMDRFGLRRTMTAVVLLFGAVCVATSQVSGVITLFLAFLMLRMCGPGALGLLSGNTLQFWFHRRLGTVEGLRHFGMAGAIGLAPGLNLWLIHTLGWRSAWVALGIGVWLIMLPLMIFLFRNRPQEVGQRIDGDASLPSPLPTEDRDKDQGTDAADKPDDQRHQAAPERTGPGIAFTFAQARQTRAFWIVCALLAMWSLLATAVTFNIVPLFASRGLSETDAAWLFTVFAVSLAAMQLIGGVLADRYPLRVLLSIAAAALTGTMAMFWSIGSAAMVLPLGLMMGLTQGLLTASAGPLWPRYFGTAHIGKIRGTVATMMVGSSSVGPFILGRCFDLTGSYEVALLLFMLAPAPMIALALLATPPRAPEAV